MLINNQAKLDLNVKVTVLNENNEPVQKLRLKNTATNRLTEGIALFLAGDDAASNGKWRPNFISFGTTGIDRQPTASNPNATIYDPIAFENPNPEDGERTRPWFKSRMIGERTDGFWNPKYGWGTAEKPNVACFQGELATCVGSYTDAQLNNLEYWTQQGYIQSGRHQILRADVTTDDSNARVYGKEEAVTDCILYGYSSVKWAEKFFNPPAGPSVPRIAISELGLYEGQSNSTYGAKTLMAGFRVPTAEDVIYIEPGYVVLVEWRVSVCAIKPANVIYTDGAKPVGMSIRANVIDKYTIQLSAILHGPISLSQNVTWSIESPVNKYTKIDKTGKLMVSTEEEAQTITIRATSVTYPTCWCESIIIPGDDDAGTGGGSGSGSAPGSEPAPGSLINRVTGVSVALLDADDESVHFKATVLGRGNFIDTVQWSISGHEDSSTNIDANGILTLGEDETATQIQIKATADGDSDIYSVAAYVCIDPKSGTYTVSDFTISTQ